MTAIECKLLVTEKECEVLGDGVGNDNMVAGVVVVLSLVERETIFNGTGTFIHLYYFEASYIIKE